MILHLRKLVLMSLAIVFIGFSGGCRTSRPGLGADQDYLRDFPARPSVSLINVVVEIPAGTTAKWEVEKKSGKLKWEIKDGVARRIHYLGYPGNYGMVPRTLLPLERGGDGDPLDAIILGPAIPRGEVVAVRPLGILRLKDGGEVDDKILAVKPDSPFGEMRSLNELTKNYPEVLRIIEIWFRNYKGKDVIETLGFDGQEAALLAVEKAIEAFEGNQG